MYMYICVYVHIKLSNMSPVPLFVAHPWGSTQEYIYVYMYMYIYTAAWQVEVYAHQGFKRVHER